ERYVLAVAPKDLADFEAICERERCPFAVVGTAIDEQHLLVNDTLLNTNPVDLPMNVLFGKPPRMHKDAVSRAPAPQSLPTDIDLADAINRVLGHPTVGSKNFLITIGDRTVGGLVSRDQMVGPWQTPVADVAVSASGFLGYSGEAMAMGERTPAALLDSPASGRMAVAESITNIAAARIDDISDIKLSANWMAAVGHPGEDANLYRTVQAVGMDLCPRLGICIPVGKDSMSMQTRWQDGDEDKRVTSPLSLIISAFAPVTDIRSTLTPEMQRDDDTVLLLADIAGGRQRLGGSVLAQCFGVIGDAAPDVDEPERLAGFFRLMQNPEVRDRILAYHDRSDGGLFAAAAEMAFAGRAGVSLQVPEDDDVVSWLFNEEAGALLQVQSADADIVTEAFRSVGVDCYIAGQPTIQQRVIVMSAGAEIYASSRAALQSRWASVSHAIQRLRDNPDCADEEYATLQDDADPGLSVSLSYDINEDIAAPYIATGVRPRVAILREQGVNSQMEMAAAFGKAGFTAVDVHMSEILSGQVTLDGFKGIMACGG
ncbi:MAG: phosphoribosylformylglycinamidine synthase subunit PurQ, partial [Pseudomonadales bacterium]|nr:phosphoribosylformylglycinamidine synthase subunit PurQ [Pseudomonadales bacterium]